MLDPPIRSWRHHLVAALCASWCWTACAAAAPPSPAARVHVLLIGIGAYPDDSGVERLKGPVNDVALVRAVLLERYAVRPEDVTVLTDRAATHTAVAAAFARLARETGPNDKVYIQYSGHGSTADDPAELRGEDQTLVGYGARSAGFAGDDSLDILDKELALWLDPLYRITPDVVFVADSCHSATVTRGSQVGVRSAPRAVEGRPHPLLASIRRVAAPTGGLRIGAARDIESALELDPETGRGCDNASRCYGVFSWYWAKALREAPPGQSWSEIFARARLMIAAVPGVAQQPQIEGVADRAAFAGAATAPLRAIGVRSVDGSRIGLDAGLLAGVTVGSTFAPVTSPAADAASATEVRIERVDALSSDGVLAGGGRLATGDRLVETRHASSVPPIALFVGGDDPGGIDRDTLATLRRALQGDPQQPPLPGFVLTADAAAADLRVHLSRAVHAAAVVAGTPLPRPSACATASACPPREAWVVSRAGGLLNAKLRLPFDAPAEATPRLIEDLRRYAWAQEVKRLAASGNRLPVSATVTAYRPATPQDDCPFEGSDSARATWRQLGPFAFGSPELKPEVGDCLAFGIENRDPAASYHVYILAIGSDMAVQPVFPARFTVDDEARFDRGEKRLIKSSFYQLTDVGTETLALLVSDGPVRTLTLAQAGLRSASGPASVLETLLASGARTRDGQVKVSPVKSWGAESASYEVKLP